MPPYLTRQAPWFSFLIHPRDTTDLHAVPGSSLIAQHSATEEEFATKICSLPATVVGTVAFGFSPVWGELIAVIRMPGTVLRPEGRKLILDAAMLSAKRGTRVIGLGALTAPATRGGLTLVPELPRQVTVTTGNAFTAAVVRRNVEEASRFLGLGLGASVAVLGATGSVGAAASQLMLDAGFELTLIGRNAARVERELGHLAGRAKLSVSSSDVAACDIVVLLTSDPSAQITPGLVRSGAVVIDFAQPPNIAAAASRQFAVCGVHVAQGGFVRIPGYHCTTDLRFPDRRSTLACLAETYLFAREGIHEHSVGHATVGLAREMESLAERHGIAMRPLGLTPLGPGQVPEANGRAAELIGFDAQGSART